MLWSIIPEDVVFNGWAEEAANMSAEPSAEPDACRCCNPKYFLQSQRQNFAAEIKDYRHFCRIKNS